MKWASVQRLLLWLAAAIVAVPVAAVLLYILYVVAWFNAGVLYSGDGIYRRGAGEAAFQVELPPVDLTRPGRSEYRFTRLGPPMRYVIGFRVRDQNGAAVRLDDGRSDLPAADRPNAWVRIELHNEKGQTVFRHSRPLQDWNWLRNMAVIDGELTEVPIGGGSVEIKLLGVGPDGGWGTHFEPRYFGTYTLIVDVESASTNAQRQTVRPVIEAYMALP